jgi:hypothetical protein
MIIQHEKNRIFLKRNKNLNKKKSCAIINSKTGKKKSRKKMIIIKITYIH